MSEIKGLVKNNAQQHSKAFIDKVARGQPDFPVTVADRI